MNDSMPDKATIEELRDWLDDALRLVELGGGREEERAEFRRRKDDLLARLLPPEDPS
jgi:hypothetical protein